jgi:hypothetical protein
MLLQPVSCSIASRQRKDLLKRPLRQRMTTASAQPIQKPVPNERKVVGWGLRGAIYADDIAERSVLPHSGMLPGAPRLPHRHVPVASSYSAAEGHT